MGRAIGGQGGGVGDASLEMEALSRKLFFSSDLTIHTPQKYQIG